jgi:hypothetical protein
MYQLRKCERYTNWEATEAVDLNPEDFRDLSFPYEGEDEEAFVNYIQEFYYEDWYELCDELEESGKTEAADAIASLFEGDMEIYSSTTDKTETMWFDIGEADPSWTKYGGFNAKFNTLSEDY